MYDDTIAAIATPLGEAAIGIVRLSGPRAREIGQRVFSRMLRDHRVVLGALRDAASGEAVDQAMGVYLAAPRTYTREDMVEFSCHGGVLPQRRALELLLREGARLAEPGEFTLRAFYNGRIDLAQAEAVLDVVQAKTQAGLQLALRGLEGALSQRVRALREALLEPLAYLTALVDFPEDEVGIQDISAGLAATVAELRTLLQDADQGIAYRHGIRTAIVGSPNAGKSSLLNRLLGQERAIVTEIPGTTRDTVEDTLNLSGVPFVLIDTAGITQTTDPVEHLGVARSRRAMEEADLVLWVLDSSRPVSDSDREIACQAGGRQVLVVANKRDLPAAPWLPGAAPDVEVCTLLGDAPELQGRRWPWRYVSALTGEGLAAMQECMVELALGGAPRGEALLVSNPRHKAALERALSHAQAALAAYQAAMPADFITIDLTAAVHALGEITGETAGEDLLDAIFSKFCIGK